MAFRDENYQARIFFLSRLPLSVRNILRLPCLKPIRNFYIWGHSFHSPSFRLGLSHPHPYLLFLHHCFIRSIQSQEPGNGVAKCHSPLGCLGFPQSVIKSPPSIYLMLLNYWPPNFHRLGLSWQLAYLCALSTAPDCAERHDDKYIPLENCEVASWLLLSFPLLLWKRLAVAVICYPLVTHPAPCSPSCCSNS